MSKRDIHQAITNQIIDLLEQVSIADYQAPFASLVDQGLPYNAVTEANYSGVNVPALWIAQQVNAFSTCIWATFKQWKTLGATVKKGEKSTQIVFYKQYKGKEKDEAGNEQEFTIPVLKTYNVFNADQVEGYEVKSLPEAERENLVTPHEAINAYVTNTNATIKEGTKAAYWIDQDYITMPPKPAFNDTKFRKASDNFHSVLFHELTHWTGSKQRLDREGITTNNTKGKYAFEELVAELGAAFQCAKFGIGQTGHEDHAIYIQSWLKALKNDNQFIFKASAAASKAVEFMDQLQSEVI